MGLSLVTRQLKAEGSLHGLIALSTSVGTPHSLIMWLLCMVEESLSSLIAT